MRAAIAILLVAAGAAAYTRSVSNTGIPLFRTDNANIQFQVSSTFFAGAKNSEGGVMITSSSNPISALQAAASQWASVPTAKIGFAPLITGSALENDPSDKKHVMTIVDTPGNRSVVGTFLAITLWQYDNTGAITDTDIIYNPKNLDGSGAQIAFSTDHTVNTYDLRALTTHEIGHALGANHSGVVGATMYQNLLPLEAYDTVTETTLPDRLSVDDVAFATAVYPAPGASALYGTISGVAAFTSGAPIKGGLVEAIDSSTGINIGGFTSISDGSYTISMMPPGNYRVFVQPLNGPVTPANLNLSSTQVTTSFRTTFAGGNTSPTSFRLTAGGTATANISVDIAAAVLGVTHLGVGSAGGTDYTFADLKAVTAGQSFDILLWGAGLDSSVKESELLILAPGTTLQVGTLHTQSTAATGGLTPIRFTVNVAASSALSLSAIGVVRGTDAGIRNGGLILLPNVTGPSFTLTGITNGASFASGSVAPGEIFTIFGSALGPAQITYAGVSAAGRVATYAGNTRVYFDDLPAPLIYTSAGQVAGTVPYAVAGNGTTSVRVEYNGVSSAKVAATVAASAPGIFKADASGQGAILNQDYSANSTKNPAAVGTVVQIYATGEGQSTPLGVDGLLATGSVLPAPTLTNTSVTIGGQPATLQYAGAAPGFAAGLWQVNAFVPKGVTGAALVVVKIGSASSQSGITVAVK